MESSSPSMEMEEIIKHMKLFDPTFPSKTHEDSRTKAKVKLDFRNEIRFDDVSWSRKQALFQTTVKNDRLLLTFAVENNDILAATLTGLTSSEKNDKFDSIYTFFTLHDVKKKNVLNSSNTREFVLSSVNPNVQPQQELEAIVVKFSRNQERFITTVVLSGGTHGVPNVPADRWQSGGVFDCGGLDEGCKIRTLPNHDTGARFELSGNGEVGEKRPKFSLSPLKEVILLVEYNSLLSGLHAFSISISVVECWK
ncbi:hypothetical protein L2E82_50908 [Cichorium intybus]|nr:hypothetical protein L2E82_50908 [Cichorium intybus]